MYFKRWNSKTYHILYHPESGGAVPPCGVKADPNELRKYQAGEPTSTIVAQIPPRGRLCQKCEEGRRKRA